MLVVCCIIECLCFFVLLSNAINYNNKIINQTSSIHAPLSISLPFCLYYIIPIKSAILKLILLFLIIFTISYFFFYCINMVVDVS